MLFLGPGGKKRVKGGKTIGVHWPLFKVEFEVSLLKKGFLEFPCQHTKVRPATRAYEAHNFVRRHHANSGKMIMQFRREEMCCESQKGVGESAGSMIKFFCDRQAFMSICLLIAR